MRRVWTSRHPAAAAARLGLRPAAAAYALAARLHERAYERGWRARVPLPLPSVGVGSLQVGGAGKTPVASWLAGWLVGRGARPAILLRGYGKDEGPLHRALVPEAVVVEDPDRARGAHTARRLGASVAVLDDNAQHLRVRPDYQLLLFGAEALGDPRALLPAGPWRAPWHGGRPDLLVLTRRQASDAAVEAAHRALRGAYPHVPFAIARLAITGWRPLHGGPGLPDAMLATHRLLALCGIADPRPFLAHVRRAGMLQGARCLRDHAPYPVRRVRRIVQAAETAGVDYVVTTAKDAVKLRAVWPADAPPVLVADLAVSWDEGEAHIVRALAAVLPGTETPSRSTRAAAGAAAGTS